MRFFSDGALMRNAPAPPVSPEGGLPAFPGNAFPVPPIAPEPNFPVYPGDNIPVPPIAPGPGFPVFPGDNYPVPPIAPGPGFPVFPGDNYPVPPIAPSPNPPAYPGGNFPITPIAPSPNPPAYPGITQGMCRVRILNAAAGYMPLRVSIGGNTLIPSISYGNLSNYREVPDGFSMVTVSTAGEPRSVLLRRSLPFRAGNSMTLAIVNTSSNITLVPVFDDACRCLPPEMGYLRCVNLSATSPPLDWVLYDDKIIFSDIRFKEITPFKSIRPGSYMFYIAPTMPSLGIEPAQGADNPEVLASIAYDAQPGAICTAYFIGLIDSLETPFQVLMVVDR